MNAPAKASAFIPADLPEPSFDDLAHLPGMQPARVRMLRTIKFLQDPLGNSQKLLDDYGRVFRRQDFGGWGVSLIGPEANELVMFNKDKIFSSSLGWNPVLENLFPHGLMLMDFEEHRVHRKALSVAFKTEPMQQYLVDLNSGIQRNIAKWPNAPTFKFYPAIKALTLDLAAASFLGVPWGPDADKINKAFADMVKASIAIVRKPLPLTQMRRGMKGREYMSAFFAREIPKRRGATGEDIFTQICNTTDEEGVLLSDQAVIDHMNFLMMAAHDTTTSSITSTVHFLGQYPEWQDKIRAEIHAVKAKTGGVLTYEVARRARNDRAGLQGIAAPHPAGAVDAAPRAEGLCLHEPPHPGGVACRHQPDDHPPPAGRVAGTGKVRSAAFHGGKLRRAGTNTPGCPLAAASTCASACTLPTCR